MKTIINMSLAPYGDGQGDKIYAVINADVVEEAVITFWQAKDEDHLHGLLENDHVKDMNDDLEVYMEELARFNVDIWPDQIKFSLIGIIQNQ